MGRSVDAMDMKLELVMVPVTDIDRAKEFYVRAGFVCDHDQTVSEEIRFVQLTPPGSACSIAIGRGLTGMAPGSLDNLQAVVADADETLADLRGRGVECEGRRRAGLGPVRALPRPRRQPVDAAAAARVVRLRRLTTGRR